MRVASSGQPSTPSHATSATHTHTHTHKTHKDTHAEVSVPASMTRAEDSVQEHLTRAYSAATCVMIFCKTTRVKRAPMGSLSPDAKATPIAADAEYLCDMMSGHAMARPSGML